ncbi:MAG: polysaccharide deacetylase family protein [Planctomycetes bacterium]|nr:polysaccharide deacetylase family protein [Planctomycetota bacterium]
MPTLTFYYHNIISGDHIGKSAISLKNFTKSLDFIRRFGYSFTDLGSIINSLKLEKIPKQCLITFDDGYENNITALPILHEYGIKAVFFLISSKINKEGFLSAKQINEIISEGHSVGSHTSTHPELTSLDPVKLKAELLDSKKELEDITGHEITSLAYPKGLYNAKSVEAAETCGYVTAFSTKHGEPYKWENRFRLKRYPVSGRDSSIKMFFKIFRRAITQ